MAVTRISSAIPTLATGSIRHHSLTSSLPQISHRFRLLCSRASCTSARNGASRHDTSLSQLQRSHALNVKRVGTFSTSVIRRSRSDDAAYSPPKPPQVRHSLSTGLQGSNTLCICMRYIELRIKSDVIYYLARSTALFVNNFLYSEISLLEKPQSMIIYIEPC